MIQTEHEGPLATMDVKDFVLTVGSRSPSPGGGSVAALCASMVSLVLVGVHGAVVSPFPGVGVGGLLLLCMVSLVLVSVHNAVILPSPGGWGGGWHCCCSLHL